MTSYSSKQYGKLLAETLPGVIKNDQEYARIETIFNELFSKGEDNLSPEEDRLFDLLADLMESYEARTLPPLDPVSPADALKFIMEQNDLKQADLVDVFKSQPAVSRAMSGERGITKEQAKRLAARFRVSAELFI